MANPTAPLDSSGAKMGFGIYLDGAADAPAWVRILNAAVVADETTVSGAMSVASMRVHDATDVAALGPLKIGGYAKAAAPTDVSADADIVNAWFALNGALHVVPTGGGGLAGIKDDAAFTPGSSGVVMAGFEADETATDSVDEGDGGAARMTLDRKVIVTTQPHTAGGLQTANFTSSDGGTALTNTAQAIKASAGQVYGWAMMNPNDETCYVNFYNTAAGSVTVGTTNPLFQFPLPAGAAANLIGAMGIEFTNAGFSASATKTAGSNTAPDTALEVAVFYK